MMKKFTFDCQYSQKRPRRKRQKINPEWDHLTKTAVEAQNAGMSYGKYVAMKYEKEQRKLALEKEWMERKRMDKEKRGIQRRLCVYCAAKFDEGFDLKEMNEETFDKCDECGKKSVVKRFYIKKHR